MGNDEEFLLMLEMVNKHKITPIIDKTFSIHEINKGFEYAVDKGRFGKVCFLHD